MNAVDKVAEILEELVDEVDTLTTKGLLCEGDIECLERAAGVAELFLRPQEPGEPDLSQLAEAHFNQLTPAQAERLAILAEECSEVIQIIGKILRHGLYSAHPITGEVNIDALLREIIDVKAAMVIVSVDAPAIMIDSPVQEAAIVQAINKKLTYAHHQEPEFSEYLATLNLTL